MEKKFNKLLAVMLDNYNNSGMLSLFEYSQLFLLANMTKEEQQK